MVFSSLVFLLLFLPCVLAVYYIARGVRARNLVLCLFSLLFYAWGEPLYLFLMLGMILINYVCALRMEKLPDKKARRLPLVAALIADIGAIGFFKYGDFTLINLNALFHTQIPLMGLTLPIGISFFTFQILSYTVDVYRQEVPAQKSLLKLTAYVCLFPQLVAGPIVRYQTVAAELDERHESLELFSEGLLRFIAGLGKKVIFANSMAMIADTVYSESAAPTAVWWLAAAAYMLQIYFDFSGYSDMAIGMGKMFGFRFLENFNYPYIASSVTDFWRRWHISLSSWFRDYVYIPLGGNRVSLPRFVLNMLIVWALTGLWHGAQWNFVLWGLYYFLLLILEKLVFKRVLAKMPAFIGHVLTLFLVLMGWVLFRAENMAQLGVMLRGMFTLSSGTVSFLAAHQEVLRPLYLLLPACIGCLPVIRHLNARFGDSPVYQTARTLTAAALFGLCIFILLGATYNPFIYFRF